MIYQIKIFLAKILTLEIIGRLIRNLNGGILKRHGQRFTLEPKALHDQMVACLYFNLYESSEIRYVKRHLRTDLPIIELGTSIGVIASVARLQNKHPLICIEANKDLVPVIEHNFNLNKISNYKIINAAIGYEKEGQLFFIPGENNISGRLSDKKTADSIEVKMVTLNSIIDANNLKEFILICDIEGAEAQIIKYDGESLSNCRQLIIETHEVEIAGEVFTPGSMKRKLIEFGFKLKEEYRSNFVFER